jgi:hypothetical protein
LLSPLSVSTPPTITASVSIVISTPCAKKAKIAVGARQ